MAVMQSIVFATIVLFVVFIDKAYTIRCYQCNSVNDTGCNNKENIPEIYMKDCPTRKSSGSEDGRKENEILQPILCRKVDQTIEYSVNGLEPDKRIIRSCGYIETTHWDKCFTRSGYGGTQLVCSCTDKDGCNGSVGLKQSIYFLLSLITLFSVFMKLFR